MTQTAGETHVYAFEAKSIQAYIVEGGRLRDIVAASVIVDRLCRWPTTRGESRPDMVEAVLDALPDRTKINFARRAAGGLIAFSSDAGALTLFRQLWTLAVQQATPGLDFADALVLSNGDTLADTMSRLPVALRAARNVVSVPLPVPGPLVRRAPRTGHPVVDVEKGAGREALDASLKRKRATANDTTAPDTGNLLLDADTQFGVWPKNLEPATALPEELDSHFPFRGGDRTVGLLHADANGLGKTIIALTMALRNEPPATTMEMLVAFSQAIEAATRQAARTATSEVLWPRRSGNRLPARPIFLAGDDLTIMLRGDVALPFAEQFLLAFDSATREHLERFKKAYPAARSVVPDALSAGAGVAFARSSTPFFRLLALADGLTSFAKREAKRVGRSEPLAPSTLAFHRVTGEVAGSYEEHIVPNELTTTFGGSDIRLTSGPYVVQGPTGSLPTLAFLNRLKTQIERTSGLRSALRAIAALAQSSPISAHQRYLRWREVIKERSKSQLAEFDDLFPAVVQSKAPFPVIGDGSTTPLLDALALLSVERSDELVGDASNV